MPKSKAQIQMEIDVFGREMLSGSEDELDFLEHVYVKSKRKKINLSQESQDELTAKSPKPKASETKIPIWKDDDDEIGDIQGLKDRKGFKKVTGKQDSKYRSRLEESFQLVHGPTPAWAELSKSNSKTKRKQLVPSDSDDDSDVGNYGFAAKMVAKSLLRRNKLDILKVLDLNNCCRNPEIIRSVEFHPTAQVGLVAGTNKVALVKVDGKDNSLIQTVSFDGFQIHNATFSSDGSEFYVSSGKSGEFWAYDMKSGKITKVPPSVLTKNETIRRLVVSPDNKILVTVGHQGNMFVRAKESKEVIHTLKANSEEVNDIAFDTNGKFMFASTAGGEIFQYDMTSFSCTGKLTDDGSVNGSRVAVSKYHLASGSDSGIVNIYDLNAVCKESTKVRPLRSIKNIRTKISSLQFNHSGDILAMASNEKPNAIRMVHMQSLTVYSNFPYDNTFWKQPNCLAFSPNDGYFSLGNNTGSAYLFRINHYENY